MSSMTFVIRSLLETSCSADQNIGVVKHRAAVKDNFKYINLKYEIFGNFIYNNKTWYDTFNEIVC